MVQCFKNIHFVFRCFLLRLVQMDVYFFHNNFLAIMFSLAQINGTEILVSPFSDMEFSFRIKFFLFNYSHPNVPFPSFFSKLNLSTLAGMFTVNFWLQSKSAFLKTYKIYLFSGTINYFDTLVTFLKHLTRKKTHKHFKIFQERLQELLLCTSHWAS